MTALNENCPLTLVDVLTADFKPFEDDDWDLFSGCESSDPMIAYKDNLVLVMERLEDTVRIDIFDDEGSCWNWSVSKRLAQIN